MSARLTAAMRAALLAPRSAGSQAHAENRATLTALTRRGLATHLGSGYYKLTALGAGKRAAIERAARAERAEQVEPVEDAPPTCGRSWVAEIALCPRCGLDSAAHGAAGADSTRNAAWRAQGPTS